MNNFVMERWFKRIETHPWWGVAFAVVWIALVSGIGFFWHLGSTGLIDETEPLFAEASRQMLVRNDWITPYFNNETRFDKPALIYWCQAIAYQLIGVNEWAVRLPSAIAALFVVAFTFYILNWYYRQQDATLRVTRPLHRWLIPALASAIIALNPEMIIWGRTGVSDMMLTGCMVGGLLCFFLGYASPTLPSNSPFATSPWYWAFYILIAAAILTKGPVGIVLPGLIIGAFLIYVGNFWTVVREMRLYIGLPLIFLLAAPWYILVSLRNGESYISTFFGYHNVERFTGVVNGHSAPWYFYFVIILLLFAPYSVYLPAAMVRLKFWQRRLFLDVPRFQQFELYVFAWFTGIFVFFSIAVTKLPSYVLPLMPAAAILIAFHWSDFLPGSVPAIGTENINHRSWRWSSWINVVYITAIGIALFYVSQIIGFDPAAPKFREALQESGLTVIGGTIWLVTSIILAALIIRRRWLAILPVNLVAFSLFLLIVLTPALFINDRERQLPLRELAKAAVTNQQPNEEVVMVGFLKPTFVFYSQLSITHIKSGSQAGDYVKTAVAKSPSVLILAQPEKLTEMGLTSTDYTVIQEKGVYKLVRFPQLNPRKGSRGGSADVET